MQRRDALGALLSLPALSQAAPGTSVRSRPLKEGLGLNVKFGQGQPLRDLPMLQELGVRWVRDSLPWRLFEPRPGQWERGPAAWQQRLAFYRDHDIGVVCLLPLMNTVAYPPSAEQPSRHTDPQAFGEQALRMAKLLRDAGVRFVLEIGNEPHNGFLPKLLGGHWSGRAPAPWLDHYVRLTHAAVKAVKAFDPSIRVLTDDDLWVVHYRFLDAGLPPSLNGFAVHPYSRAPERVARQDGDWVRPYQPADDDLSMASAVRRLRDFGERKLGHRPEIWFTEWGAPVGDKPPQFVSEAVQAAFLPRAFILAEAAGVEALCWFSSHDANESSFGLLNQRGGRRQSYEAMRTLSAELGDWRLLRQILGQDQPTRGLQAFVFQKGDALKWVVWCADEERRDLRLSGPLVALDGCDALGRSISSEPWPGQSAQRRLPVSMTPLYLSSPQVHLQAGGLDSWVKHIDTEGAPR